MTNLLKTNIPNLQTPSCPKALIEGLKASGISKWRIAKRLGVSWNTVHHWDKGTFKTNRKNIIKLRGMLSDAQIK